MAAYVDPSIFPESLHPRLAAITELYERRQWHQLTQALLAFLKDPAAQLGDSLLQVRGGPHARSLPPPPPNSLTPRCPPPHARASPTHPRAAALPHLHLCL